VTIRVTGLDEETAVRKVLPTQANTSGETHMAKFYVQSGSIRAIVDSVDSDRAALWAVNEVMDGTLSLTEAAGDESETTTICKEPKTGFLGATIVVSEVGFDREDLVLDTLQVFRHWYELFQAISMMSKTFK
jgi:hypothetical protein